MTTKTRSIVPLLLSISALAVASPAASAAQFAACMIQSYDACPNLMVGSCIRYHLFGRGFESPNYYAYPLGKARNKSTAQEKLTRLRHEGVCPQRDGAESQTTMEQKYIDAAEKENVRVGKKLMRRMKHF